MIRRISHLIYENKIQNGTITILRSWIHLFNCKLRRANTISNEKFKLIEDFRQLFFNVDDEAYL